MATIILFDSDGEPRAFDTVELYNQLKNRGTQIFGMTLVEIAEFRRQYLKAGGKLPVTVKDIQTIIGGNHGSKIAES